METELIIIKELYQNSRIEPNFVTLLQSEGLIEIKLIDGEEYIYESTLSDLDRFARWYYDLSINIEGIDVIHNLLDRMNIMEKELYSLRRQFDNQPEVWDIKE